MAAGGYEPQIILERTISASKVSSAGPSALLLSEDSENPSRISAKTHRAEDCERWRNEGECHDNQVVDVGELNFEAGFRS
jgi:hypothetical protein